MEGHPSKGKTMNTTEEEKEENAADTRPMLPIRSIADRPQTLSYGLCDSPAGLLALLLDALKPTIAPLPQQPRSPPTRVQTRSRSATVIQHTTIPEESPSPNPSSPFSVIDILNWTMMYWLPGPEASLRWLLAVEKEDCYDEYSQTPLGMSWYSQGSSPQSSTGGVAASSSTSVAIESSPSPPASKTGQPASPIWASAVQDLKWVKRRSELLESGIPAWERSAEVVVDIRDFFEMGRSEGWLGL